MREGTWAQAREIASKSFTPLASERVSPRESFGRTAATELRSLCELPAFATSAMDGWAVCGSGPWQIVGEVLMGKAPTQELLTGQCMRISTGGVVPRGCEGILPWENATESANEVSGVIEAGAHIRPAGMECALGDLLASPGDRMTPALIGLLAATGHDQVEVIRKPRVAIFFLGDELIHQGVPLDGAIRDALGPQLPPLFELYGCEVVRAEFVKDDSELLNSTIKNALPDVDMIVTTGGTADGPRDFVRPAIASLAGEYLIDCVKVRPGYHILLAQIIKTNRTIPFLALPGNPQSALAALVSFGKPVIDLLVGRRAASFDELPEISLHENFKTQAGFARLVPGNVAAGQFTSSGYLGSAMLRGVANGSGFALVNEGDRSAKWLALPNIVIA